MIALISVAGDTIQHNGVEYAEEHIQAETGDLGVYIQYLSGGSNFEAGASLDGVYTAVVFDPEAHNVVRVEPGWG